MEGERLVCRLAWSQIERSQLILHEVQPTVASASRLRAIEFMYIDFTPSLICLPSLQSFRADKFKAQQRRNILSWKNQLWQICDKSQSSVHLCFTGCCKRLDIYFIQLDFHPGHAEFFHRVDQMGGKLLCFALLKPSPTSCTPDPWKYRSSAEDAGQGFLYFFFRLETGKQLELE